jgi:RHS repeat-associated protein
MSTIGMKKIATTGSGHCVPGPTPATSLVSPPQPPAPTPFAYICRSTTAALTSKKFKVGGDEVLVNGSKMDIEPPGNAPSQAGGGDILTHVVNLGCAVFTGSSKVKAGGKEVACTGDQARMNVPQGGPYAQTIGRLAMLAEVNAATNKQAYAAGGYAILDPISIASGDVLDENQDLVLPGLIGFELKRFYSSARAGETGPFGRGGWTHSYHQTVELRSGEVRLLDSDGSLHRILQDPESGTYLHRRARLEARVEACGRVVVYSLVTRLSRTFELSSPGRRHRLTEIANAAGHTIRLGYTGERLAVIVDTAGREILFSYASGGIQSICVLPSPAYRGGADGRYETHYAYDEDGNLIAATDACGEVEHYAYDLQRRLIRKTLGGLSFQFQYDEHGRCRKTWGDGGAHAGELTYDPPGGQTTLTGSLEPRIFKYRPGDGELLSVATPDASGQASYAYDDDGLLLEATNGVGEGVSFEHDERGNLTATTDALGERVELEYVHDRCIRRSAGGAVTAFRYSRNDLIEEIRYPSGNWLRFEYDPIGRLRALVGPTGVRAEYAYDEDHNRVVHRDARGGVWRWSYDAFGRAVSVADPSGATTRRAVDARDRTLAIQSDDGRMRTFTRDARGRVVREVDPAGASWTTTYLGLSSAVASVAPDGGMTRILYDPLERPQRIINPKGEPYDVRYDRAGQVREVRTFDGRLFRYQYGNDRRLRRVERPDGTWRALEHNAQGGVMAERTPEGDATVVFGEGSVEFQLDDPTGKIVTGFRRLDASSLLSWQAGQEVRFDYDGLGRCVARHLPTGVVTRLEYDDAGDVTALVHEGFRVVFKRDSAGGVVEHHLPDGGVIAHTLNAAGRRTSDRIESAGRATLEASYAYDARGFLTEMRDRDLGVVRYAYDVTGRLVAADTPWAGYQYAYGADASVFPHGANWRSAPGNRLIQTDDAVFEYDACGRRSSKVSRGQATRYLWDCRDRLREVRRPDGRRVLFTYDAAGRRVSKKVVLRVGGDLQLEREVQYVWDGDTLVLELDTERGPRTYVHDPVEKTPLLVHVGEEIFFVLNDPVGTPTALIDRAGNVVWRARRTPWGALLEGELDDVDSRVARAIPPFQLLGQQYDEETGLCYVRHRYFDPENMRFLSPDPLGIEGGVNLYAFNGNPTTHVDALGLASLLIGNPALDGIINRALNGPKVPGWFQVFVHGYPQGFYSLELDGSGRYWTPEEMTNRIAASGVYNGTDPILLGSCNAGRFEGGAAQQLSAGLGAPVTAANDYFWAPTYEIAPIAAGCAPATWTKDANGNWTPDSWEWRKVPDPSAQGQWNQWDNGAPRPGNKYPSTPPANGDPTMPMVPPGPAHYQPTNRKPPPIP